MYRPYEEITIRYLVFTAEIVWEAFRDSHCTLMTLQVQGGSSYPMVLNNCLARTTNERIAALQIWGDGPADAAIAEQAMEDTYGALGVAMGEASPVQPRLSQLRWEAYRTEHCRYEAMVQTIDTAELNRLENQCRARLAVERTAQLNHLAGMGW